MALTLTIAGENFLPQYKTGGAVITERLQNKSNSMEIQVVKKSGQSTPKQGAELILKDDSRFLFGGFITQVTPTESGKGYFFTYSLEVTDYSHLLGNKVAQTAYENSTVKEIVEDLMEKYVDSAYNFDTSNVSTGEEIGLITFDHINLRRCFEKIAKRTGRVWWVDYERNLHFKSVQDDVAPEDIRDSDASNHKDLQIIYDTTQVRNSVIVIGSDSGQEAETSNVQTFEGDGETRSWSLDDKPSTVVHIKVNGDSKQFSLDVNERDTDYFTYSFSGASFRLTDSQTTPEAGDTIEIEYYPSIPIIVRKLDKDSIDFFKKLEGGDGEHQYTLKDSSIGSKESAFERAQQELDDFAYPLVNGYFTTDSSMLQAGSVFKTGQRLTVNSPSWGIDNDSAFTIQEVKVELKEDGNDIIYQYKVRFGGKLVGVQEFLEHLAQEGESTSEASEIKTLFVTSDTVVLADGNLSRLNETPPYEYGSDSVQGNPQGRWNLSEWS